MDLKVDFKFGRVYEQIVSGVRAAAISGALRPGEELPAISRLAQELRVNRNSIARAYSELERLNVIEPVLNSRYLLKKGLPLSRMNDRDRLPMKHIKGSRFQESRRVPEDLRLTLMMPGTLRLGCFSGERFMKPMDRCHQCGGVSPRISMLGGGCPRCLLELILTESRSVRDSECSLIQHVEKDATHPPAIGGYRILRVVGEGGMGVVYEAEQDRPRRMVALKIIKPSMASPEMFRRLERESHALGRLQHAGVAQIYEAGKVDTGSVPQPYFAMELIRGLSPREYAQTHHLNTRDRLVMMVKICDAVHHAHQRGLIHRDLKPGNILVDATGQPKILDFGAARVTDRDARATLHTHMGQLVGTLAYMSPEQALADPIDIDARSDVYALGVILYELLTGRLPYTIGKKLHEAIQAIRDADPVPLGTFNRAYRGDIEAIVRKALEKNRTRRYASAAGMAEDIQRYLNAELIAARPPSASYQLRKFVVRNRARVLGAAAVLVFLIAGVILGMALATLGQA